MQCAVCKLGVTSEEQNVPHMVLSPVGQVQQQEETLLGCERAQQANRHGQASPGGTRQHGRAAEEGLLRRILGPKGRLLFSRTVEICFELGNALELS